MSDPYAHPSQLRDVWLSAVSFEDTADFALAGGLSYSVHTDTDGKLHDGGQRGTATLSLEIRWWDAEGNSHPGPFALAIQVAGEFWFGAPTTDMQGRQSWLEFNTLHMLWPYARSYVGHITSMSKHQPLTLFTMQVPRPRALEQETQDFERIVRDDPGHTSPAG